MKKALLFVLMVGVAAAGCAPGAAFYDHDIVEPAGEVSMMPATGGTVEVSSLGPVAIKLGALVSMAWPQGDDVDWESSTFQVDAILQVDLPMNLGLDARVGFLTYEADVGSEELDINPVSLMLTYRFDVMPETAQLYIGLGLAFLFNDLSEASSADLDDAVGFKAALGATFNLHQKFALGIDVSYLTASADTEGLADEEWDMDNVTAGVSFLFRF